MKLLDTNHPFFKPLWLRIVVVAIAAGWAVFEFRSGSTVWGLIFAAFAAVSAHGFFINFNPDETDRPE